MSFSEWWQDLYRTEDLDSGFICRRCGLRNVWALTKHAENVHGDVLPDELRAKRRRGDDRSDFRGVRRPHTPEQVAEEFHATYERLAPTFGYQTRDASAVAWADVPEANRLLMVETVKVLMKNGVIRPGGL